MMFLQMCGKTITAKNTLEWNQRDETSLFIYCQSMVEQQLVEVSAAGSRPRYWDLFEGSRTSLHAIEAYQ